MSALLVRLPLTSKVKSWSTLPSKRVNVDSPACGSVVAELTLPTWAGAEGWSTQIRCQIALKRDVWRGKPFFSVGRRLVFFGNLHGVPPTVGICFFLKWARFDNNRLGELNPRGESWDLKSLVKKLEIQKLGPRVKFSNPSFLGPSVPSLILRVHPFLFRNLCEKQLETTTKVLMPATQKPRGPWKNPPNIRETFPMPKFDCQSSNSYSQRIPPKNVSKQTTNTKQHVWQHWPGLPNEGLIFTNKNSLEKSDLPRIFGQKVSGWYRSGYIHNYFGMRSNPFRWHEPFFVAMVYHYTKTSVQFYVFCWCILLGWSLLKANESKKLISTKTSTGRKPKIHGQLGL